MGTRAYLPTNRAHFGPGSLKKLEEEARDFDRAFVITGRTLSKETDLVRRVEGMLGEKHAGTLSAMGQHTPGSAVEKAAAAVGGPGQLARVGGGGHPPGGAVGEAAEEVGEADLLVSVGGGSVIDGAKAVAVRLDYPAQVAVPTTPPAAGGAPAGGAHGGG